MSVPEGARGDGKFTLPTKAEELACYTLRITANEKIFLPEYQRALTDDLILQAKNAYLYIREANDITVKRDSNTFIRDLHERQRLQLQAIKCMKRMLPLIDLAKKVFHLELRRVKYWGEMVINVRERTRKWMESDARRFADEEQ